MVIVIR